MGLRSPGPRGRKHLTSFVCPEHGAGAAARLSSGLAGQAALLLLPAACSLETCLMKVAPRAFVAEAAEPYEAYSAAFVCMPLSHVRIPYFGHWHIQTMALPRR